MQDTEYGIRNGNGNMRYGMVDMECGILDTEYGMLDMEYGMEYEIHSYLTIDESCWQP